MVPLFDPKPQHAQVADEVHAQTRAVLDSGQFILGPNVQAFEEEAARFHDLSHGIGVASGTDALHLALLAAGIGPGDEVITSAFSFIAGVEAIFYCGAKPVFVDIREDSMNLDESTIEAAVTERTRAIMPVHLFGLACDMDQIMSVAQRHDLKVIEDCAQAFGARFKDKPVGAFGHAGCFSFFPTKNLGGYGDGGLITTADAVLDEQARVLRNHGSRERYHHHCVGFNSRLDEVQAAALRVKLRHLEDFNQSRRDIAAIYDQGLDGLPLQTPAVPEGCYAVYGQYTVQLDQRDKVREALQEKGIASAIYYPIPLHRQAVCGDEYASISLPVTERVSERCLSLPMFPGMSKDQAEEVIAALWTILT
ncbi:dTDP-4-amino-4,6-dideoxygalactose transaminase [Natronospira proteinivora]|uniref:dTDP-4-amino-4,6-dideoxygalactose transaminase n=1 Tax=Natronospira proteinivora TaxID=1807133 RepID=A0ABT1G882_9GAMM|nr:DegT/DnrJ/EryC1/StrS family aminotransferase [Natronospira proteinivora]MCP1726518.1 dTDP-4-amino-4,6-dideoxygalactose transaminase [Natronospira proteinivora]